MYDDYFNSLNLQDSELNLSELNEHKQADHRIFVEGIKYVSEKKDKDRELFMNLILYFIKNSLYSAQHIHTAMNTFLAMAEDFSVDVPKTPVYIGTFLGQLIAEQVLSCDYLMSEEFRNELYVDSGNALKSAIICLDYLATKQSYESMRTYIQSNNIQLTQIAATYENSKEEILANIAKWSKYDFTDLIQ